MIKHNRKIRYFIYVFCISTIIFILNYFAVLPTNSNVLTKTIVLDAGHGGEDGGATSKSGIVEKDLNLKITLKVEKLLKKEGFNVILTRSDDIQLDNGGSTIKQRKVSDLNKRISIINKSKADIVVSIHMNSFTQEKYYGWQTFYKKNCIYSSEVAKNIQKCIGDEINIENNRVAMEIKGVKIIEKSIKPAVLVECGFLSNEEEAKRLLDDEYQNKLAQGIVNGIKTMYE